MQNNLKKAISTLLGGLLIISSYKSKLIITMNNDIRKYPMIPSGDSVHYVEYIKEPFQMLFYADVIDHPIYSLISQNKDKIISQTRVDDKNVTQEVSKAAIEVNKAFYSFVIDLISQSKKDFKREESSDSLSGETLFK